MKKIISLAVLSGIFGVTAILATLRLLPISESDAWLLRDASGLGFVFTFFPMIGALIDRRRDRAAAKPVGSH